MGLNTGELEALTRYLKACVGAKTSPQPTNGMFPSEASLDPGRVCCFMDTLGGHPHSPDLPQEGSSTNPQSRGSALAARKWGVQAKSATLNQYPSVYCNPLPRGEVPIEDIRPVLGLSNVMWSWGSCWRDGAWAARSECSGSPSPCAMPPLIKCYQAMQGQGHTLCVS